MASIVVNGDTSGAVTLSAPAVAGTVTVTLPSASGTMAVSGGSPSFTTITTTSDASISGLTVGKGGGAVSTNTAVGNGAIAATATGNRLVALGYQALASDTSGYQNTAIGHQSLNVNADGTNNTAVGCFSLVSNVSGSQNVAVGDQSLYYNTGSLNTAVGRGSLQSNTVGNYNTGVGYQAGFSNVQGSANTFFGYQAGYTFAASSATSTYNTFLGYSAGYAATTGTNNTFVGTGAGQSVTTGGKNTILGNYSGNQGGLDIRTASNYIVLSDGDGNPRITVAGAYVGIASTAPNGTSQNGVVFQPSGWGTNKTYTSVIGASSSNGEFAYELFSSSLNQSQFYVGYGGTVYARSTSITGLSDITEKENIKPLETGLSEILALQPRRFDWKNGSKQNVAGFIAQEVELILPDLIEDYILNKETSETKKGLKMGDMMPTLVKAIQELKAELDTVKAELAALKG